MNVLGVISDILSPPVLPPTGHPTQDILYEIKDPEDKLNGNLDKSIESPTSLFDVEQAFDSLCLNIATTTKPRSATLESANVNEDSESKTSDSCLQQTYKQKDLKNATSHRYISREEVAGHCSINSCWIIVDGKVFDVTQFLREHPGGPEIMLEHAGWDASSAFADVGHSPDALEIMDCYFVGLLQTQM